MIRHAADSAVLSANYNIKPDDWIKTLVYCLGKKRGSPRARRTDQQHAQSYAVSRAAYREFGLSFAFTAVAEKPVLWCPRSLRHLHGEAQRLTSSRRSIKVSGRIRAGLEGLVTAEAAGSIIM